MLEVHCRSRMSPMLGNTFQLSVLTPRSEASARLHSDMPSLLTRGLPAPGSFCRVEPTVVLRKAPSPIPKLQISASSTPNAPPGVTSKFSPVRLLFNLADSWTDQPEYHPD